MLCKGVLYIYIISKNTLPCLGPVKKLITVKIQLVFNDIQRPKRHNNVQIATRFFPATLINGLLELEQSL